MGSLSTELLGLVGELQSLSSLDCFAVAGGTNLSYRYNHRESVDIDLFSDVMVGKTGLKRIEDQLRETFKDRILFLNIEDPGHGVQYCFIKSLIRQGETAIKVELLQNIPFLNPVEKINNIRLVSVPDVGIMKLQSVSSRMAQKDVYDLDRVTDDIPLGELMELLKVKEEKFKGDQYRSLFDLDNSPSPTSNPSLLLAFDKINYTQIEKRPSHSQDILKLDENSKGWLVARAHWRRKVLSYCKENNFSVRQARGMRPKR
ncbi:MAG: nucleotidyl transferase AbiEii/AbiGii toxin family protein [Flavisolibacter sp.]